ncbi:MAG TPA: GAF domain-containing protein [Candidatus Eisenbacteria bacterium]|nr:GAF domain-containing protein [Candidatus Eisenbacteria bacterium]
MIPLESLTPCFQGIIPSWLYTCSKDGIPNAAILSHVDYVDARHVALSFQFFNKSKRNVAENPKAAVRIIDADTMKAYRLKLRFVRTETEGPTFESMRLRIEAIASYSGLKGIFKLLGADIYEVLSVAPIEYEPGVAAAPGAAPGLANEGARLPFTMKALQEFSDRIHHAPTLDHMLDEILETLENIFGFRHSMILLASERPDRLELIASRGYPERGVGSEVGFGEGLIGMVAEARKPIRITGMMRQMLYADAVRRHARGSGLCPEDRRIPLPGLPDPEFQLGIPLLARGELIGVLCIETDCPYRFHEEDRAYLEVMGGFLAIAIQNALFRERTEETEDAAASRGVEAPGTTAPPGPAAAATTTSGSSSPPRARIKVEYYSADECVLVDGEYLVRGLPAKILRKLLHEHAAMGSVEFTNRRLRLDKTLQLPEIKDNLESRLILLRRRLEERCPEIRLFPAGRGRFRLELRSEVELKEGPGG